MRRRLTSIAPYPPVSDPSDAGRIFLRTWLEALSSSFEVIALYPVSPEQAGGEADIDGIHGYGIPSRPETGWARLASGLGPTRDVLDNILRGPASSYVIDADIVETQWPGMVGLLRPLRRVHQGILAHVAHDVRAEALASQASQLRSPRQIASAVGKLPRVVPQEVRGIRSTDVTWCFKQGDVELLGLVAPAVRRELLFPIFPNRSLTSVRPRTGRCNLVFVGDLSRVENAYSLERFVTDIWPHVTRQIACARLSVIGRGAGERLTRLLDKDGINLAGWVDDLSVAYSEADAAIAPLRYRGGIKFKVAEAIAAGLPVIASPVAASGYDGTLRQAVYVARGPDDWVSQIVAATKAGSGLETRVELARATLYSNFDRDALVARAVDVYSGTARSKGSS